MATSRPRGFVPWRPQAKTVPLLEQIQVVLAEYQESLPLTGRQIFYRLVATADYPKTQKDYKALLEVINRARRAGLIPMDHIRDDGTTVVGDGRFDGAEQFVRGSVHWAEAFRLDLLSYQDRHLIVLCEAAGMVPQLARVAEPFGIEVRSSGGFDSTTAKHSLGRLCGAISKPVSLIHIGDLDPSGEHIHLNLGEDVGAFAAHYGNSEVEVVRVAVTAEQQAIHDLPTAPPKAGDRREFAHDFTVQAEALPPDVLAEVVREAIEERTDQDRLSAALHRQGEIREDLGARFRQLAEEYRAG
jgi:hypothetical protein